MKETEQGKFMGVNWLTGRKVYLTPKEEAIIKKQQWTIIKVFLWIFGIYIGLMLLWILLSI